MGRASRTSLLPARTQLYGVINNGLRSVWSFFRRDNFIFIRTERLRTAVNYVDHNGYKTRWRLKMGSWFLVKSIGGLNWISLESSSRKISLAETGITHAPATPDKIPQTAFREVTN